MRTTIRLDDALLRRAKAAAAASGKSLNALIEDAVRAAMAPRKSTGRNETATPTYDGGGLQSGVDLVDSAALLDLMDATERTAALERVGVLRSPTAKLPRDWLQRRPAIKADVVAELLDERDAGR